MKTIGIAAAIITVIASSTIATAQQMTPEQSKAMDDAIRGTTLTRCAPEIKNCVQPPVIKAQPGAPYSQWGSQFGNGDPEQLRKR